MKEANNWEHIQYPQLGTYKPDHSIVYFLAYGVGVCLRDNNIYRYETLPIELYSENWDMAQFKPSNLKMDFVSDLESNSSDIIKANTVQLEANNNLLQVLAEMFNFNESVEALKTSYIQGNNAIINLNKELV